MESKEALHWWSELSMNEQEQYRMAHPFFSHMGKDYFGLHKTSITQVYEYFKLKPVKTFNFQIKVGRSKYVINYHDGIKKHEDGSDFFDIAIFSNKKLFNKFMDDLLSKGYIYL